jgi:hypothetical protein
MEFLKDNVTVASRKDLLRVRDHFSKGNHEW